MPSARTRPGVSRSSTNDSSDSGVLATGRARSRRLNFWFNASCAAKFIRESMPPVENHPGPSSQPATSGGSKSCCPMLIRGVSVLASEKPFQPDFLQRTDDEFHRPRIALVEVAVLVELRRRQQPADHRFDLEAAVVINLRDVLEQRLIRGVGLVHEEVVKLPCEPRACRGMARDRIDQIETVLHSLCGRPRGYHLAAVRVDRERELLGVGVVRAGDVVERVVRVARAAPGSSR